ncbi:MAG: histidinol-phosphate aminotransferase family protein, partial [Gammaproteobacteria bacterium]|nr:histidinol-phosphate aminotransferase family protein [Gammaproteobacteria bacterium]
MAINRRDVLSASALLLAGPGFALRAAADGAAAPLVLCWNENPYGPSPAARRAAAAALADACRYPSDADLEGLTAALAAHEQV